MTTARFMNAMSRLWDCISDFREIHKANFHKGESSTPFPQLVARNWSDQVTTIARLVTAVSRLSRDGSGECNSVSHDIAALPSERFDRLGTEIIAWLTNVEKAERQDSTALFDYLLDVAHGCHCEIDVNMIAILSGNEASVPDMIQILQGVNTTQFAISSKLEHYQTKSQMAYLFGPSDLNNSRKGKRQSISCTGQKVPCSAYG